MNVGKAIQVTMAVVALVGAGVLLVRWAAQDRSGYEDFPEGTFWVCTNPECVHEFTLSLDQVAAFYRENSEVPMACPQCGKPAVRALRCPFCERFFPRPGRGRTLPTCPHCRRELPKATDSGD